MSQTEILHRHAASCEECKRVERGESPVCSPRYVLEILAKDEVTR